MADEATPTPRIDVGPLRGVASGTSRGIIEALTPEQKDEIIYATLNALMWRGHLRGKLNPGVNMVSIILDKVNDYLREVTGTCLPVYT